MASEPAEILRAMADRVDRNDADEFGGVLLVIPPPTQDGSGGDPVEVLLIDPAQDTANFWATATTKLKAAADAYPDSEAGITARYHYAASLAATGKYDEAVRAFEDVASILHDVQQASAEYWKRP